MGLPAERVGVRTPSLYKHVDSLDALQWGVGRSGPDAVRAIAEAYQAVTYEAVQILLDAVAGFGLTDERAIDAVRALRTVIHGFVGLVSNDAFQIERDPADSYRFVVDTLINGMRAEAAIGGPDTAPLHAGEGP
ncbi:TetR-like C-terminal domain-containing protein [Streptomyces sp. NPDC002769]|uniref:TetR-like C-terminal domain-containing protein n=1 Tax=Streptomyces sp. NPDC002769 TaxID=3154542 RepID=UPI00332449CF